MRKGRSQRKSRVSLPPRAARSKPSHAEVGSDPGPHVVTGVIGQRPEPVDTNTRSEGSPEAQPMTRSPRPTLEMLAEPMLERVREAERLERVNQELRSAIDESPEEAEARDLGDPPPAPAPTELPRVEAVIPVTAAHVTVKSAYHDESPIRPVAVRMSEPSSDDMSDEISIPPVGDLAVEPIADRFFSEGEIVAARASAAEHEHEHEWAEVVARESRKSLPEVVERRARLSKYVRWAVGGAALVCLAAVGRTLVVPTTHASLAAESANALTAPANATSPSPPEPKAAAAAVITTAAPPTPAPAEQAAAEPTKTAELAAAPATEPTDPARVEAPRVDIPKTEVPAEPAAPTADVKANALIEKRDARRALERGKATEAIAAGERSVALDPTDGEAWLLLGAAYQDKGKMAEARRAYTACTKEGTRGPIGECRAMLR